MPEVAYRYAIPGKLYKEMGIRKYGFHGTSHKFISQKALEHLGNPDAKVVTIHLGNGASMAAVASGKCQDTTMGIGPLCGLIMGTRCGDIDPAHHLPPHRAEGIQCRGSFCDLKQGKRHERVNRRYRYA